MWVCQRSLFDGRKLIVLLRRRFELVWHVRWVGNPCDLENCVAAWLGPRNLGEKIQIDVFWWGEGLSRITKIYGGHAWHTFETAWNETVCTCNIRGRWLSGSCSLTGDCPKFVISDDGPQFVSYQFEEFLREQGIRHIKTKGIFVSLTRKWWSGKV